MVVFGIYTDHARAINMILLGLVVAALTANMIIRRNYLNRRTRRILGWLFLILINFIYAYSISIQDNRPYNASVGIASILLLGTIFAIAWHPPGDDKTPPHDGAVTSRFMFWLDRKVRAFKSRHHLGGYK